MDHHFYESNYKKLGFVAVDSGTFNEINDERYKSYIKILHLPAGYKLMVDFKQYTTNHPSLFFINSNQYLQVLEAGTERAFMIYYNRDFYCVQLHDAEVACDGLLFNNIYEMPMTELPEKEIPVIKGIYEQMQEEFFMEASSQEEMIRTYLKQLIIRATRTWKSQQLGKLNDEPHRELEFFREFSRLVDMHYREKHTVADYAPLMGIAPKTLTHRLRKLNLPQPNDIIKNRIVLEAKRLLTYTAMSAKEIAYHLGYEDPAYFNRLFSQKAGGTTTDFKRKYPAGKNVQ